MDSYPTTRKLGNGATVGDWLGTSKTAAEVAVLMIERVRLNTSTMPVLSLQRAENELTQALQELRFVREQVEGITHSGIIDRISLSEES
jgi:RecB family exonuclease